MGEYVADLGPELAAAAALFKSLSHPSRLLICCQLLDGPMSVNDLEENLSLRQPNLSRELAKLRAEGVAISKRVGGAVTYQLLDERVRWILEAYRSKGASVSSAPNFARLNGQGGTTLSQFQSTGAMFARTFDVKEDN